MKNTLQQLMVMALPFLLTVGLATAQQSAPQMFNYQGIARDAIGSVLANQNIGLQISIRQGPVIGYAVKNQKKGEYFVEILLQPGRYYSPEFDNPPTNTSQK